MSFSKGDSFHGLIPGRTVRQEFTPSTLSTFDEISSLKRTDIYGTCNIDTPWVTVEEFNQNVQALPDVVRRFLLGDTLGTKQKKQKTPRELELDKLFGLEPTPEERAQWIIERGRGAAISYLEMLIPNYLTQRMLLAKQWDERMKRGTSGEVITQEAINLIQKFAQDGQAPYMSVVELTLREEELAKEVKRLESDKSARIVRLKSLRHEHFYEKKKHKQRTLGIRLSQEEEFLGVKSYQEVDPGSLLYGEGYLGDLQSQINFNQRELGEVKRSLEEASLIEEVDKKIYPLSMDETITIWLGVAKAMPNEELEASVLDAVVAFVSQPLSGEKGTKTDGRNPQKALGVLKREFNRTHDYLARTDRADSSSIRSSVLHGQLILRKFLDILSQNSDIELDPKKKSD